MKQTNCVRSVTNEFLSISPIPPFQDGVSCKEVLTKQDHLNVVTATYNFITDANGIWNLGNCNSEPFGILLLFKHGFLHK